MSREIKYKPQIPRKIIVSTHIENDLVNNTPTLVFTDTAGQEWVYEEQTSDHAGYITRLVHKEKSWFFNTNNKTKN
jgi:hypothetical protein